MRVRAKPTLVIPEKAGISWGGVPTVIIHGTEDWIIPVDDGRALHQAAAGAPKRLVEIPGAGHNDLMMVDQRSYFLAVRNLVVAGSV